VEQQPQEPEKDEANLLLEKEMDEAKSKLKKYFETWKTFEKACEVLMNAIIAKEKGDANVPQQKEKLGEFCDVF
jgi:hypothetical protein